MKVKDLVSCCYDTIIIYKSVNEDFEDLYKGKKENIPDDLLKLKTFLKGKYLKRKFCFI